MKIIYSRPFFILLFLLLSASSLKAQTSLGEARRNRNVVVWISIDGFRPDYLSKASTPNLDKLISQSLHSFNLIPTFPTLTFPSHVTQATGVKSGAHGITLNSFYDSKTKAVYNYPGDSRLLQSEAIWNTAKRQNIRTLVYDWTLSHAQTGPHKTDYHHDKFDPDLTDSQRLNSVLKTWRNDFTKRPSQPLQLIMGYIVGTDRPGHIYGPNSPEMVVATQGVDRLIGSFYEEALDIFKKNYDFKDQLYFLITTDHGMSEIEHLVNPRRLTGLEGRDDITVITGGNIAHIFFDNLSSQREKRRLTRSITERIKKYSFSKLYSKKELPKKWAYKHPSRVGDLVIVLDLGHAFSGRAPNVLADPREIGGPLGMHGYDPRENSEMNGIFLLSRHPNPFKKTHLEQVRSIELHGFVANLLSNAPSKKATKTKLQAP